jgi:excisionase family DNA binding protein
VHKEAQRMKALHDVKQAAALLAVSPWTVRAYIRQGKLHPVRIGRLVRLDEEELSRFVANGKATGDRFSNQIQVGEEQ